MSAPAVPADCEICGAKDTPENDTVPTLACKLCRRHVTGDAIRLLREAVKLFDGAAHVYGWVWDARELLYRLDDHHGT